MDFLTLSSYGTGTKTSGTVRIVRDIVDDVRGRDVLLVEGVSAAATWNITQHRGHAFSRAAQFVRVGRDTGFAKRVGHEAFALRSEIWAIGMSVGIGIRR